MGQRHQAKHLYSIFEQPTIPHLARAELAFNNFERVLDLGRYVAIFLIMPLSRRRQNSSRLVVIFDRPSGPFDQKRSHRPCGSDRRSFLHMDLACCGLDRVHETTFGVHANMRLYSEIPRINFRCLAHIRVTLVGPVLGQQRSCNQGGISAVCPYAAWCKTGQSEPQDVPNALPLPSRLEKYRA